MENQNESRTKATTKNMIWGIISKMISLLLQFISRTLFIYVLGKELLGVNSLYTEVLSMLSLAELGFGTAFTFALYKPIAENNEEKIRQLIFLFKKIYYIIALIVLCIGFVLVPLLQFIVQGADYVSLNELRIYFVIFLSNTVINYFVQYKTTYVNARMKSYVVTNIEMITNFVIIVTQCLIIYFFRNYLAYLLVNTGLLLLSKIVIALYLNMKFPILNEKPQEPLPKNEKKEIYTEVKGLALQNFAGVAIHSTDNLIISMASGLGVVGVGLVSNYNIIITAVTAFIVILMTSLTPGFGNLVATSTQEHYKETFNEVNFYNFWIYGFCSIAFFVLIPPFITLWLGEDYLIDIWPFLLIIINIYMQGQCTIYNNARNAKGNFNLDKWISVIQAIINLVVSIICAKVWGLLGVYIGTIVSRLFFVIARPIKTYRFLYGSSSLYYFRDFIIYFLVTIFAGVTTYYVTKNVFNNGVTIPNFILSCVIVTCIPNVIFFVVFVRTRYMKMLLKRIKRVVKRNG